MPLNTKQGLLNKGLGKQAFGLLSLIFLIGCVHVDESENSTDDGIKTPLSSEVPALTVGNWYQPSVLTSWQWQLDGALNTGFTADVYDIDLFDTSVASIQQLQADNHKVICYFSAGSYENWREDEESFSASDYGRNLDGWEGERWLDIRSANVHNIMLARLDLAVEKGCDGVEPDNVDGYTNKTGFSLIANDQLAYNRFLANEAHKRGLSIGLKNDLDQIPLLVDYYDFAVVEQCFEFDECEALTPFTDAGKAALSAEYADRYVSDITIRTSLCIEAMNIQFSTLIMPIELNDSFRHSCL
jgi:hypothetical protein